MFCWRHILTPVACLRFNQHLGGGAYLCTRELFIFGVRVAYWTVAA